MSTGSQKSGGGGGNKSVEDRTKKAQASRAITQAKLDKLSMRDKYAYGKIHSCRRALDALSAQVVDGGECSGDLLSAIASLEGHIGQCMFLES